MQNKDDAGVLSVCASCKFAEWEKTTSGRRHPSGMGECRFELPETPLPKWSSERNYKTRQRLATVREYFAQREHLRHIWYRDRHRTQPETCATYEATK